MIRRLLLLNGLAILAVVSNHAVVWGFLAMFWWVDRYRPVAVPNYDQFGTVPYYFLVGVSRLGAFAVPAFLFVSGFFVAYAARGDQSAPKWKIMVVRLKILLIPYLIWSAVIFAGDALQQGKILAPTEYLTRLAIGGAHPVYFYVPLLCQFYLLSPLVVGIAKSRWRLLLLTSALLQLGVLCLRYLNLFGVEIPTLRAATDLLFPMYAFFFAAGLVLGFHLQELKERLARLKWRLLAALIVLGWLTAVESEVVYRLSGIRRGAGPTTIPASLYAAAFIFCFLAFHRTSIPVSKEIYWLGGASYGIYLLHPKVLEFSAKAMQKFVPWILAYHVLFQLTLVVLGVGGPLLFMTLVAKSPARRAYRYLFG